MKSWKNLIFNTQNIERQTQKAVLIKMPRSSKYSGWAFWHPKKLIRKAGGKGYFLSLAYTEDWRFTLKKGSQEKVVGPSEIEESFSKGHKTMRFAIEQTKPYDPIHVPEKLELDEEVTVIEDLKDD